METSFPRRALSGSKTGLSGGNRTGLRTWSMLCLISSTNALPCHCWSKVSQGFFLPWIAITEFPAIFWKCKFRLSMFTKLQQLSLLTKIQKQNLLMGSHFTVFSSLHLCFHKKSALFLIWFMASKPIIIAPCYAKTILFIQDLETIYKSNAILCEKCSYLHNVRRFQIFTIVFRNLAYISIVVSC